MNSKVIYNGPYYPNRVVSRFINKAANSNKVKEIIVDGYTQQVKLFYDAGGRRFITFEMIDNFEDLVKAEYL